jgi:glycosyltransferase involved in cell wall biosynthesis
MKHKLEILVNTNDIHILIPTYNRIDQIKKTINSVINQTYQGWLLTIIDNNSSDNTVDILNYEYKDLIKKKKIIIKPFRNFVNQAKNWNRCIEYVGNYRYFKLLCSDDVLDKNFLLIAKEKLDPTDASVAGFSSDINYININDEYIGSRSYGFFGLELWVSIFYRNYIGTPSSQLLKTNLFKNSEYILIPYCGDLLYLVDYCYSKNKKFVFHNSPLVNFRLWQDSDSFKLYGEKSMIDGRSRGRKMMIKKIFKKKTASVFFIAVSNSLFYIETIFFWYNNIF